MTEKEFVEMVARLKPYDPEIGEAQDAMNQLIAAAKEITQASSRTYTVFCRDPDDVDSTTWIDEVEANDVEDARVQARAKCAEAWGYDAANVECFGVADAANINMLFWED